MIIDLTNAVKHISKNFLSVFKSDKRYQLLYGGAGSGKSYFQSQRVVLKTFINKNYKILVLRKVANTLRFSVWARISNQIADWNLTPCFNINKSSFEISNNETDSSIIFLGLDDVEKLKSIDNINEIWVEEATEISQADFEQLDLRLRGKGKNKHIITLTFNPINEKNWINKAFFINPIDPENTLIHKSTAFENEFIDEEFLQKLEKLKERNENLYNIYRWGLWGQVENVVFSNYTIQTLEQNTEYYDDVVFGIDFGFNNPSACLKVAIKDNEIYILKEFYKSGLGNSDLIKELKKKYPEYTKHIFTADSAEPARIKEFKQAGFKIRPANKKAGSIETGIDWIRERKVYIDKSCVNLISEFESYQYKKDKNDVILDQFVKENDHAIDALRYALQDYIKRGGKINVREL